MSRREAVRNLEALLDSGYPSTLFGRPVVIRNDDLETEIKRIAGGKTIVRPSRTHVSESDFRAFFGSRVTH